MVARNQFRRIVAVVLANSPAVAEARSILGPGVEVLTDPDGSVHASLNASWTPRYYVLDGMLRLKWVQRSRTERPDFIKTASQLGEVRQ
jgi:hypothetical protein